MLTGAIATLPVAVSPVAGGILPAVTVSTLIAVTTFPVDRLVLAGATVRVAETASPERLVYAAVIDRQCATSAIVRAASTAPFAVCPPDMDLAA